MHFYLSLFQKNSVISIESTKRDRLTLIIPFYCRELFEESGLTVNELQEAGILKFEFLGEPEIMEVRVFTTNKYEGTPTESEGKIKFN